MRDRIDQVVEEWGHERPELDLRSAAVILRLRRLARILEREVNAFLSGYGLGGGAFAILSALRRRGPPFEMSSSALGADALLSPSAMTYRLDRLEARGLVKRVRNPSDRRSYWIRLTDEGKTLTDEVIEAQAENGRRLLRPLDASQQDALGNLMRQLILGLEAPAPGPERPE
jgi:DNA-binding MarR family transcriptional regulator